MSWLVRLGSDSDTMIGLLLFLGVLKESQQNPKIVAMSTSAPPALPPAIIAAVEVEPRLCLWCTLVTDAEVGFNEEELLAGFGSDGLKMFVGLEPQVRYDYSRSIQDKWSW